MKLSKSLFLFALLGLMGLSWPFSDLFSPATSNKEPLGSNTWVQRQIQVLQSQAKNIDPAVLRLSLVAYANAKKRGLTDSKPYLTVIDFSKPSTEKRLWVFDLKNGRTLFNTFVSHGKNSGDIKSTSFSNAPGSLKSSIGVFLTAQPYIGGKGYALRLRGLEQGINDNVYRRYIVIHGAWYANPETLQKYGKIGRSWGCPAVGTQLIRPLVDTIKQNTLVVAYYPDKKWLSNSRFLTL